MKKFAGSAFAVVVFAFAAIFCDAFSCLAADEREKGGALTIPFDAASESGAACAEGLDFYGPYGFKISPDGSLFLANTVKNNVLQFDFMGRLIKGYSGPDSVFGAPGDVSFDSEGMLYFANLEKMCVYKVDMLCEVKQSYGGYGTSEAGLLSIHQIEAAPGKKLYVQDTLSSKINVYSPVGAFIKNVRCNVPGFAVNAKGQLIFMRRDTVTGYSVNALDPNARIPFRLFDIGMADDGGVSFLGVDYSGAVYVLPSGRAGDGERTVMVYRHDGLLWAKHSIKRSPLTRQFFIFGDGSIYSAEVDRDPATKAPLKLSVRKY